MIVQVFGLVSVGQLPGDIQHYAVAQLPRVAQQPAVVQLPEVVQLPAGNRHLPHVAHLGSGLTRPLLSQQPSLARFGTDLPKPMQDSSL